MDGIQVTQSTPPQTAAPTLDADSSDHANARPVFPLRHGAKFRFCEGLMRAGHIDAKAFETLYRQPADPALLARRLVQSGTLSEPAALTGLAELDGTRLLDLDTHPCNPDHAHSLSADRAIALSCVPCERIGHRLVVATSRPDLAAEIRRALPQDDIVLALATQAQITSAIGALYGRKLAREAECRSPHETSARVWTGPGLALGLAVPGLVLAALAVAFPAAFVSVAVIVSMAVFTINMLLKFAAAIATIGARRKARPAGPKGAIPLFAEPVITIMVPLFKETDVAGALLDRLGRLDYPRHALDVIFVLEASDHLTRAALQDCDLPFWARAIIVPPGHPQTKPRALNYALPFARGTIIGIYDAEDSPDPDQLRRVAARFAEAPAQTACLQGQLDYYNADHNWLSRCFTLEYATWFRLLLPGVARLGLVVPLGGTTLFVKRDVLLKVGGWDAHNVTEDAELGIRLQRAGYRTELIETTTFEEANSAIWPWIRQRSRWLKGYAMTWATVMRHPVALWHELGPWRFAGLQAQFVGTVLGFVTAPILWSLAIIPFGLPHPAANLPFLQATGPFSTAVVATLVLTLALSWIACAAPHLRRQRKALPLLILYFPLATVAAVLAVLDLALRPFYWAKTAHGCYPAEPAVSSDPASVLSRTSNARLR